MVSSRAFTLVSLLLAALEPSWSQSHGDKKLAARSSGQHTQSVDHAGHVISESRAGHGRHGPAGVPHMMRAEPAASAEHREPSAHGHRAAARPTVPRPMAEEEEAGSADDFDGGVGLLLESSARPASRFAKADGVAASMTEASESEEALNILPTALKNFILGKKATAPKLSCGEGKLGHCGPCMVDGKMEAGDPSHPGDARMCLLGDCLKLCDLDDGKLIVQNDACPKAMNMTTAKFTEFQKENCGGSSCFPGHAQVQVRGRGRMNIRDLREQDHVLVEGSAGKLVFEPVLGFIHSVHNSRASFLVVKHELGELRVSEEHLVFVVAGSNRRTEKPAVDLRVGDRLLAMAGSDEALDTTALPSRVLSVRLERDSRGMYAPITPAGTIVVDGTVASNYAVPPGVHLPHGAIHAAFFPVRAYHWLRLRLSELATTSYLAPRFGESTGRSFAAFVSLGFAGAPQVSA